MITLIWVLKALLKFMAKDLRRTCCDLGWHWNQRCFFLNNPTKWGLYCHICGKEKIIREWWGWLPNPVWQARQNYE